MKYTHRSFMDDRSILYYNLDEHGEYLDGKIIGSNGKIEYIYRLATKNNNVPMQLYFRIDGPALIFPDGRLWYYQNIPKFVDKQSRRPFPNRTDGGPVIVNPEGKEFLTLADWARTGLR